MLKKEGPAPTIKIKNEIGLPLNIDSHRHKNPLLLIQAVNDFCDYINWILEFREFYGDIDFFA